MIYEYIYTGENMNVKPVCVLHIILILNHVCEW